MKKKLLFVTQALWIGGIETALVNLLHRLDHKKYEVTVLILRDEQDMTPRLPEQVRLVVLDRKQADYGYSRLYHLTEKPENPSRLHKAMMWAVPAVKWIENRLFIRHVRRKMAGERFDTCVIYSDVAAETAVRAIDADKFVMFYHHGAMRRVYHDEIGYRRCEKIVTVSTVQEQKLRAFRPRYAERMTTVHNLVNVEEILEKAEMPVAEQFDPNLFHVVSCGRVSKEKGMDLAVAACANLVAAGHEKIHWWIVGGGPAEAEVRAKIAELHMENRVTMLGMQANPYPYIQAADLYVQPSRFEGYPMTILEALILGKTVVSTDNGGAGEILEPGVTGILCPISPDGIAEAVEELLNRPEKLDRLRANVASRDMDAENRKAIRQLETLL